MYFSMELLCFSVVLLESCSVRHNVSDSKVSCELIYYDMGQTYYKAYGG